MANLLLTEKCVRSCPYCFASAHMARSNNEGLSWDNLMYVADFIAASGEKSISVLGGEPTLHPHFVDYTLYLIERGFNVVVFTSGIMTEQTLEDAASALLTIPRDNLRFVCNINDPEQTGTTQAEQQAAECFLSVFGPRTSVSFNIYRTDFQLDYALGCVNRFGMDRYIRLGLAHPIPGTQNACVPPDRMGDVFIQLTKYMDIVEHNRIHVGFDCGFPMCKINDELLVRLIRSSFGGLRFICCPAVDIGPDLSLWCCFPLSGFHKRSLFDFNSLQEVHDYYRKLIDMVHVEIAGIYNECDGCRQRDDGICSGGCHAHLLQRILMAPQVRSPELCAT